MVNCERLLFAIAKNGVGTVGVPGASGSFSSAGLLWIQCVTAKCSKFFWVIFAASRNGLGWSGYVQWAHRASVEYVAM